MQPPLTADDTTKVAALLALGFTQAQVARLYGCGQSAISRYVIEHHIPHTSYSDLSAHAVAELDRLRHAGYTTVETARIVGCSKEAVARRWHLKLAAGEYEPRTRRVTPEEREAWLAAYQRGYSANTIAKRAGRDHGAVTRALEAALGKKYKPRGGDWVKLGPLKLL